MKFMMAQKKEIWLVIISVLDEAISFQDLKRNYIMGISDFQDMLFVKMNQKGKLIKMKKEDLKRGLEDYYFEKYKDTAGLTKVQLEEKTGLNCRDLYVRIQNYQIEKYGDSLAFNRTYTYLNNKKTKDVKSITRRKLEDKQDYITKKIIERNEKRGN